MPFGVTCSLCRTNIFFGNWNFRKKRIKLESSVYPFVTKMTVFSSFFVCLFLHFFWCGQNCFICDMFNCLFKIGYKKTKQVNVLKMQTFKIQDMRDWGCVVGNGVNLVVQKCGTHKYPSYRKEYEAESVMKTVGKWRGWKASLSCLLRERCTGSDDQQIGRKIIKP